MTAALAEPLAAAWRPDATRDGRQTFAREKT